MYRLDVYFHRFMKFFEVAVYRDRFGIMIDLIIPRGTHTKENKTFLECSRLVGSGKCERRKKIKWDAAAHS